MTHIIHINLTDDPQTFLKGWEGGVGSLTVKDCCNFLAVGHSNKFRSRQGLNIKILLTYIIEPLMKCPGSIYPSFNFTYFNNIGIQAQNISIYKFSVNFVCCGYCNVKLHLYLSSCLTHVILKRFKHYQSQFLCNKLRPSIYFHFTLI